MPLAHRAQNDPTAVLNSAPSDVSEVAPVMLLSSHEGRTTQDVEAYRDSKMGKPSHLWPYFNAEGTLVGYAARWDLPSGKQIRPLTLSGKGRWQQKGIPTPRPLYNLLELNYRPQDPVLVVEGEKTCDAAKDLLPGFVSVTSAGGAMSSHFTDWTPLKGRNVTICHDNDPDGFAYAENVAKLAHEHGATSVKVVTLPEGLPAHWDLADPIPENVDMDIARLVAEAKPVASVDKEPQVDEETDILSRRQSAGDQLFQWAKEALDLYADGDVTYADLRLEGGRETLSIRSRSFARWLRGLYYERTDRGAAQEAVNHAVENLDALAVRAEQRRVYLRTASHGGRLYIDLVDDHRRVVEFGPEGWRVITDPPVRFRRSPTTNPLPMPAMVDACEGIGELRKYLNVGDDDFVLCVAWLLASLRNTGPYPLLILTGEQGSSKSTAAKVLRSLVDPASPLTRGMPRDERDAAITTRNNWVIVLDNLSGLPIWLSDMLCRFSTGEGFATRALFTDTEEVVIEASRPVILTGIENVAVRGDLADRALIVRLAPIAETDRRIELDLWADFEEARPRILGALLEGLCEGFRQLPKVKLRRLPRMADFATWSTACEGAYWSAGTFMTAYDKALASATEDVLEDSWVWPALRKFLEMERRFDGTASQLLSLLNADRQDERVPKGWPASGASLGKMLSRLAPSMRQLGYAVQLTRSVSEDSQERFGWWE